MSVYKSLTTSDVICTPFKVNKNFTFIGDSEFTSSNVSIDRFLGKNIPYVSGSNTTGQLKTQSQALIYNSIKQLYYTNYLRGEDGSIAFTSSVGIDGVRIGQEGTEQPSYENYLFVIVTGKQCPRVRKLPIMLKRKKVQKQVSNTSQPLKRAK